MSAIDLSRSAKISRWLITIATVVYGFIPPIVDLTATHVFHPDWMPHARLHAVWQLATNSGLALLALYLMWAQSTNGLQRIRFAGLVGLCVYAGFFVSALTHPLFGGALADEQGGVPTVMGLYGNVIAFTPMLILIILGLWLSRSDAAN